MTDRRAIMLVCDGLGADWLRPELTPTLCALAQRSVRVPGIRAVFPSVTRVSAASIATGCHPARHGLLGNKVALREGERLVVHNVGHPNFRHAMRAATGTTLRVPTMAQRLAHVGGQVAFSNVSPGAAYFLDPEHFGTVMHRAGSFAPGGAALAGDAALNVSHDLDGDRAMTARFIDEVVNAGQCRVGILWLANPDLTTHHAPMGSPAHLEALRVVDGLVGEVVAAVRARKDSDRTLITIGSDHGHETIGAAVDVGEWLAGNGLADEIRDGKVAVAGQGTAALVCALDSARARVEAVLPLLRTQPWAGAVHAGDALAALGVGPADGLVAAIDMARRDEVNPFGVPGMRWLVADGEAEKEIGCGQHGGLGPQETRPFLVLDVPRMAAGEVSRPASLVDIAPTVLGWLGVAAEGMDGASLLG
jgi:hypothetical protein